MPTASTASTTRRPTRQGTSLVPVTFSLLPSPTVPVALPGRTTSGHGRHDRDLVGCRHGRIQALSHTHVLIVEEEVDKLPRLSFVVQQPPPETRKYRVELVDGRADIAGINGYGGFAAAQASQRSGNAENGHFQSSLRNLTRTLFRGTISDLALFPNAAPRHRWRLRRRF